MLFWLGSAIVVLGVLNFFVRFQPFEDWLRGKWPCAKKWHFHVASVVFFMLVSLIGLWINYQKSLPVVSHVDAQVELSISANWVDKAGPQGILTQPWPGAALVQLVYPEEKPPTASLHASRAATITSAPNGVTHVLYYAETRQVSPILGQTVNTFEHMAALRVIAMFGHLPDSGAIRSGPVTVRRVYVSLKVNGTNPYEIKREFDPPVAVPAGRWFDIPLTAPLQRAS